jgi:hypothetical protein
MDDSGQKGFIWMTYAVLILVIALSTYLHHFQPQVLKVPSNRDVSTWKHPTFEQTAIYDRMTEAERLKVRTEGIPDGCDLKAQFEVDLFMIIVGLFCYRHSRINFGFLMASCFLIGSFVYTGLVESIFILTGRFLGGTLNFEPGGVLLGTYWFSKGCFWFVETPLVACLGWYAIAYSCVWVAGKVFPKMGLWPRAAVGGFIAMNTDLWADPVATSPELMNWVWGKGDFFMLFGIPFYNFIGWFLIIFLFAVFWESLPLMEMKWGRVKGAAYFMAVCTGGAFVTALFIFVFWFVIAGGIASLAGMRPYQLPSGW